MKQEVQGETDLDELAGRWKDTSGGDSMPGDSGSQGKLDVEQVAEAITASDHFARNAGGKLYVYRDGVYRSDGEAFIGQRVKAIYRETGKGGRWSVHKSSEVIEYIRVDCPELWEAPPLDTISVLNGLVDVPTRELRPHTPDFLSPVQIPVRFDPDATCPAWDKFIAEVFPADAQPIAWEILGWLLTPANSIQKAVLFREFSASLHDSARP